MYTFEYDSLNTCVPSSLFTFFLYIHAITGFLVFNVTLQRLVGNFPWAKSASNADFYEKGS